MLKRPDVAAELARIPMGRYAELLGAGASDWRVRTLDRVDGLRGIRAELRGEPLSAYTRIAAASKVISAEAVTTGWSGALVHGVPTDFIDGTANGTDSLPLCINPRSTQTHRVGVRFNYSRLDDCDVIELHGIRVPTGVRTTYDCIRLAPDERRALAWGDACIRFGLCTPNELADYVVDIKKARGIVRVRALIPLLTPWAESPMESAMRHVWISSGLPSPLVNPRIFDSRGKFIARVDLLDPLSGLVGEYNGSWHRKGVQPWKDTKRQRLLEAVGATVANIGGPDFGPDLEAAAVLRTEYLNAQTHGFFAVGGARVVAQTELPR